MGTFPQVAIFPFSVSAVVLAFQTAFQNPFQTAFQTPFQTAFHSLF